MAMAWYVAAVGMSQAESEGAESSADCGRLWRARSPTRRLCTLF